MIIVHLFTPLCQNSFTSSSILWDSLQYIMQVQGGHGFLPHHSEDKWGAVECRCIPESQPHPAAWLPSRNEVADAAEMK